MTTDEMLITTICYIIAFFIFLKYFKIQNKIKNAQEKEAVCTDFIVKRTYNKKYYLFFYKTNIKNEEFIIQDKFILPFFKNLIKIGNSYLVYVKSKEEYATPLEVKVYKYYLVISLLLIIVPLILIIH